ncbi:MAG: four helix bundle protein [Candidatus Riflebacteria bacterium]|nr:four helix bundle protein [Candidatus Riflebacteria bacterium]
MGENVVKEKSRAFALKIIALYKYLCYEKKEFVLSKQLVRSGTSIGANIVEAHSAISKKEFIAKMNISLKEAAETEYWLDLLQTSNYISEVEYQSMLENCRELKRLLTSIIKATRKNLLK